MHSKKAAIILAATMAAVSSSFAQVISQQAGFSPAGRYSLSLSAIKPASSTGPDEMKPDGPPSRSALDTITPAFDPYDSGDETAETEGQVLIRRNSGETTERYHWKGLFLQSAAFIGTENTYRLVSDPWMRHLLADGPYWHNYIASLKQWNMGRWWDGDDFLVDYIGHPMQGSVSALIEIQNDPRGRRLRLSDDPEYWKSRMRGLLWAAAFSTQQKVGPLGEAAIGNDGGFTYALNCPYYCTNPKAKYTNNTGWTDFIATPVVGMVWLVGEDSIDRLIDHYLASYPRSGFVNVLRGSLEPTHTMANAMRGRKPWFRDYQGIDDAPSLGHFIREAPDVPNEGPRTHLEVAPHFSGLSLPVNTPTCFRCRNLTHGYGAETAAPISRWIDFDTDFTYQPNASPMPSDRAGGDLLVGTFGLRTGVRTRHVAARVALRPGFATYNRAYLTSPTAAAPTPQVGRITHFVTALAVSGDVNVNRHLAIRGTLGNTPMRYRSTAPGTGYAIPPYLSWLSKQQFITNENWAYQTGPVLRF